MKKSSKPSKAKKNIKANVKKINKSEKSKAADQLVESGNRIET
jgi:hypothetical protein